MFASLFNSPFIPEFVAQKGCFLRYVLFSYFGINIMFLIWGYLETLSPCVVTFKCEVRHASVWSASILHRELL